MRICCLLFGLISLLPLQVPAQDLGNGRFPLMAWDFVDDPKVLQSMHEAGITAVAFVRPQTLDACQTNDLKCIVYDERLAGDLWSKPFNGDQFRKNLEILVKETSGKPALYGFHIKDEPNANEFPELAKAVAAVKAMAPGKWPYINLLPGQGKAFDKYMSDFISICKPTAVSYDRYSIIGETGTGELDPIFWSNLEQARKQALKYGLPQWNIVLTSPHWQYRKLTEDDLRLEIWGSLVYGVKGIAYYKFISRELPILQAADLGNFRDGPLDQFFEKTPTWNWLRNLNRQVQNLAPTLLKLHSEDTYHIGAIPRENHGPSERSLVIDVPGGNFVVGEFTHENGRRFVMIVNKDLKRSVHLAPKFRADIKTANVVSPITGQVKSLTSFYWLAPGQGVLLQVGE
jgi:hypothetical protein